MKENSRSVAMEASKYRQKIDNDIHGHVLETQSQEVPANDQMRMSNFNNSSLIKGPLGAEFSDV
jgi:hypothetical protein